MATIVGTLNLALMRQHIRGAEPGTAGSQRRFWRAAAEGIAAAELSSIISGQNITPAFVAFYREELSVYAADVLSDRWRASLKAGARALDSGFELLSPASIEAFVLQRQSEFISDQLDSQAKAMNLAVRRMVSSGTPESLMRDVLRATVGMTERQSRALQASIQRLRDEGASMANIEAQAGRLTRRFRLARARAIARTEIAAAYNGGTESAIVSAVQAGDLQGVSKTWRNQPNVDCDICKPLEGETVSLGSSFSNGDRVPPAHPNCRCVLTYQVD